MDSINELNNNPFPKEDEIIPKIKPVDNDFIKKEEIEEEYFAVPGIVDSLEINNKSSVKEEIFQNEQIDNFSSSNVRQIVLSLLHSIKYLIL